MINLSIKEGKITNNNHNKNSRNMLYIIALFFPASLYFLLTTDDKEEILEPYFMNMLSKGIYDYSFEF